MLETAILEVSPSVSQHVVAGLLLDIWFCQETTAAVVFYESSAARTAATRPTEPLIFYLNGSRGSVSTGSERGKKMVSAALDGLPVPAEGNHSPLSPGWRPQISHLSRRIPATIPPVDGAVV